jgi:hypothetical protein
MICGREKEDFALSQSLKTAFAALIERLWLHIMEFCNGVMKRCWGR